MIVSTRFLLDYTSLATRDSKKGLNGTIKLKNQARRYLHMRSNDGNSILEVSLSITKMTISLTISTLVIYRLLSVTRITIQFSDSLTPLRPYWCQLSTEKVKTYRLRFIILRRVLLAMNRSKLDASHLTRPVDIQLGIWKVDFSQ